MRVQDIPNDELRHVSNALDSLRDRLSSAAHGGRYLTSGEAIALMDELQGLRDHARALENEVSAHRWNEAGRIDRASERDATVLHSIVADDSNVVVFPMIMRDRPEGGAS